MLSHTCKLPRVACQYFVDERALVNFDRFIVTAVPLHESDQLTATM
jgi:hypothetical protein